jgi:hypothetical protein
VSKLAAGKLLVIDPGHFKDTGLRLGRFVASPMDGGGQAATGTDLTVPNLSKLAGSALSVLV